MNWLENKAKLKAIPFEIHLDNVPHQFLQDSTGHSVRDVRNEIISEHEQDGYVFPKNLIPIYGGFEHGSYEGDAKFLLCDLEGNFYEIHGSHCSCYGFEGQFIPEPCPIEYIVKGKVWTDALPTVIKVVDYFIENN